MAWTSADLLTTVKSRGMFPDASTGSLGAATLLQFASEELLITLVPMILSVREKYYETFVDTVLTSGVTSLPIPSRSIGNTLSCVQYLYGPDIRTLEPIDPCTIVTTQPTAYPTNFYFENNSIVLYPPPSGANGTVRMRYFQRPSRIEQVSNCAQIASFDPIANTVTCASVPSTWTAGTTLDFVPQTASRATPYGLDSPASGVTGTTISFASLPKDSKGNVLVANGDWIALSEYTPIPELPFEFQVVLAQATVCKGLESVNDQTGLGAASGKLGAYQKAAVMLMTPRDQQGQKKVVSPWRRF